MSKNKIVIVRVDERTGLIIDELCQRLRASKSCVIRALIHRSIDDLVDEEGNLKINGTQPVQEK